MTQPHLTLDEHLLECAVCRSGDDACSEGFRLAQHEQAPGVREVEARLKAIEAKP